jgi:hypothetical protein
VPKLAWHPFGDKAISPSCSRTSSCSADAMFSSDYRFLIVM